MRNTLLPAFRNMPLIPPVLLGGLLFNGLISAQNPELQQRVADIKASSLANKKSLATYTWVEQVTISLKGEEKKQEHFQVRLGPDGKPEKSSLDAPGSAPSGSSGGRLKQHVVEKKKEEYKDYAEQMKTLAQQYVPPDRDLIGNAYEKGNISIGVGGGAPNEIQLIIKNYLKPGDTLTLVFNKAEKELVGLQIASYMDDPKDAMNMRVQFSRLPDGTNHVSSLEIDGVSKQLNVAIQNSKYQHL